MENEEDHTTLEFEIEKDELLEKRIAAFSEKLRISPSFMNRDKKLSGAQLGTVIHFVMQAIDFNMEPTEKAVNEFIEDLVVNELLSQSEGKGINRNWIVNFLKSEICQRIRKSDRVVREGAFKLMIPAAEAGFSGAEENAEMLLQGIVDCLFIENGEWVILDYKTDYYEVGKEEQIAKSYGIQLDWYGRAVEIGTKVPVKEKLLYLFRGGKCIIIF